MPHPLPIHVPSDAAAVVLEAIAVERETIAATEALVAYADGRPWDPADDAARYERLREAATAVVELAWALQDPAHDGPYSALGASICERATSILEDIRTFDPTPPEGSRRAKP